MHPTSGQKKKKKKKNDEHNSIVIITFSFSKVKYKNTSHEKSIVLGEHDSQSLNLDTSHSLYYKNTSHEKLIVLDKHDSLQWYDIVHFEHKILMALLWVSREGLTRMEIVFLDYKLMIIL